MRRAAVLAAVHEPMAAAPFGRPGPRIVLHGSDSTEASDGGGPHSGDILARLLWV